MSIFYKVIKSIRYYIFIKCLLKCLSSTSTQRHFITMSMCILYNIIINKSIHVIISAKIRGTAASLATAFNWACTFLVTKTFADLLRVFGTDGTFWMFGGICLMGLVFIIFCVPETQGKSLEDIERNLTGVGKGPVRQVRRMSSIAHLKPLPMAI